MRSTSGTTCCHFFCSAVFSIPVCRYPIVVLADWMVSPSSSRMRRSTPCVLGCCGPMLTVIVSVRSSAIDYVTTKTFFNHEDAKCTPFVVQHHLVRSLQAISFEICLELVLGHFE